MEICSAPVGQLLLLQDVQCSSEHLEETVNWIDWRGVYCACRNMDDCAVRQAELSHPATEAACPQGRGEYNDIT
ncbi:MAG: hypothetical protein HKP41_06690 [Desulfobacterales bacterium]|nr:hypothetical protein [Desulfobacterales bacterium]